jgi:hypothetical protein
VAEVAGGVGQDRGSTESSLSPMCCNIFLLDICNRSVLPEMHDGESVSEDSSPLFFQMAHNRVNCSIPFAEKTP